MSSLTAIVILPTDDEYDEAPYSARQTSASSVSDFIWITISLRRLVSGSCMNTRVTPLMFR